MPASPRGSSGASPLARNYGDLRPDEQSQLLADLKALRADRLRLFLLEHELERNGNKETLAQRVIDALHRGQLKLAPVVAYLDEAAAWGKQHVLLFDPPATHADLNPRLWGDIGWLKEHLRGHKLVSLLGARKPLVLPRDMQLCAIDLNIEARRLRVEAVKRRQGTERDESLDETSEADGATVHLRAFREIVTRGLVVFEWDLRTNVGMLQIRQLPAGNTYEEAHREFANLVKKWLPIDRFTHKSLARAIPTLRSEATDPKRGIRAHGVDLVGQDGRRLIGRSQRAQQSLHGNKIIDEALDDMTEASGLGHSGNFFFTPSQPANNDNDATSAVEEDDDPDTDSEPSTDRDVHVLIYADTKNRINFTTPQTERAIRDVLQRIRSAC